MKRKSDTFGDFGPRKMPGYFFFRAVDIDFDTAVEADIDKQNYSVGPREWYIDATFECQVCKKEFLWSASEQKTWFEDYYFWIDSTPNHCKNCRREIRELKSARNEYDRSVTKALSGSDIELKKKIVKLIAILEENSNLPNRILENNRVLIKQIGKAENIASDNSDCSATSI